MGQALRGADAAAHPKRELGEDTPLRPAQPLLHAHPARRACQAHRGQHAHPCAAQQVEGQGLDQGDLKVRVREIGVSDHPPAENSSPGFFLIEKGRATVLPEMLPCYLLPAKKRMVLGIQRSIMTLLRHRKKAMAKQQAITMPAIWEGNAGRCRPSGATKM